ncbi:MAG: UbiA family prenyltransferase [Cellulosilyticum sp.]|nr:UbiA family prenyltransferase [Cellulosilyticum sp.]
MSITSFFTLVSIRTKLISILPFIFGSLYALYAFDTFMPLHAIILFLSLLFFDMTIYMLNHYTKCKKENQITVSEVHNPIIREQLNPKHAKYLITSMFFTAMSLGLYLAYLTNFLVLILGLSCLIVGILYLKGTVPISHTPLSEFFFGTTIGLTLTFISIYIHAFNTDLFILQIRANQLMMQCNLKLLIAIITVSMPFMITASNIMFANNICDVEKDLSAKHYTLPVYIGKEKALILWEISYYSVYIFILIAILTNHLPWICLASFITFVPVKHHIDHFKLRQVKNETFANAVQIFILISCSLIGTLLIDIFVNKYLF